MAADDIPISRLISVIDQEQLEEQDADPVLAERQVGRAVIHDHEFPDHVVEAAAEPFRVGGGAAGGGGG